MDWPQWVNGFKVPDFDGIFGQLNFDIETWSIMVKTCEIVQGICWNSNFRAISRGFLRKWEKPQKNEKNVKNGASGVGCSTLTAILGVSILR